MRVYKLRARLASGEAASATKPDGQRSSRVQCICFGRPAPSRLSHSSKPPHSNLTTKSVTAIGYKVGGGSTKVDLKGTELMWAASGEAKVKARPGATSIEHSLIGMTQPSALGAEFLTYVFWVVTPDGRSGNTGEIIIDKNGEGQLKATTPAQTFSLIVTAEPYFAVRYPSEMVILENHSEKAQRARYSPSLTSN